MDLKDMPLSQYASQLANRSPVPGGGSAVALAGALGASLGAMVGNLTIGKPKYAASEAELLELIKRAETLSKKFIELVDRDAAAFEPLSRAYSMSKDMPDREDIMEACLRRAADTPMEILRCCCEGIELQEAFAAIGSPLTLSDAATGTVLLWGALYGAAVNVKVNTKLMKRREYARTLNAEVDRLTEEYWKRAEELYETVYRRYC